MSRDSKCLCQKWTTWRAIDVSHQMMYIKKFSRWKYEKVLFYGLIN